MSVTLIGYSGIGEIGGNKFLLEDGELRVFLDFGRPFGRHSAFFDGVFIKERSGRGLLDPLLLGLLPPLEGLYREDLIPPLAGTRDAFWEPFRSRPDYRDLRREGPPVDAILLSHAHLDHSGDFLFVRPDIPVFSSRMTGFIAKAVQDSGRPSTAGVAYVNPQAVQEGLLVGDRNQGYIWRAWRFLDGTPEEEVAEDAPFAGAARFWRWPPTSDKKKRACTEPPPVPAPLAGLRWWPVDHSIFGACGFALETSAGWVAYTGDLRFHGARSPLSQKFVEDLAALRPLALLCEGTNLEATQQVTEGEVHERCLKAVQEATGQLAVADFAPRNVERLMTFLHIARDTGRCLVIQPRDAYLLSAMRLAEPSAVPDLANECSLAVYADPKSRQNEWERVTRETYQTKLLGPEEIRNQPGDYILALSLWDMADLLDLEYLLERRPGGVYIYSNSKAYDEEQKVDLARLWNWIEHFGMRPVGLRRDSRTGEVDVEPGYHASGHASGPELLWLVREVRPRVLIPIHTERPQRWQEELEGTGIRVAIPSYAQPVRLG